MSTFVLVHGGWQSAGTWDLLATVLRQRGSSVIVPQLTGLGTHPAPLMPAIGLNQHIEDVVAAVHQATGPVTLVGHGYGGMVISGAAERVAVDSLAYISAYLPADGQSVLDLLPAASAEQVRETAQAHGDGWRLPAYEAHLDFWGLAPGAARDFVRSRMCDFSLRCLEEPVALPAGRAWRLPARYLACMAETYPAQAMMAPFVSQAREHAWPVFELDSGHACQVENPAAVADALLSCRGRS